MVKYSYNGTLEVGPNSTKVHLWYIFVSSLIKHYKTTLTAYDTAFHTRYVPVVYRLLTITPPGE